MTQRTPEKKITLIGSVSEIQTKEDLCTRMLEHAKLHDDLAPHSDEQALWAEDLRKAVTLIRERDHYKQIAEINAETIKGIQDQRDTAYDELVHFQNAPRSFR